MKEKIRKNLSEMALKEKEENFRWASKPRLEVNDLKKLNQEDLNSLKLVEVTKALVANEELKEKNQKLQTELSNKFFDNKAEVESQTAFLNQKLQQADFEKVKLNQENKKISEKIQSLENEFKDFLIKEFFDSDYENKSLDFILTLYQERKKFNKQKETKTMPKDEIINPFENLEAYMQGLICVCGENKQFSAKSCRSCRKQAKNFAVSEDVTMPEAFEMVWKSYGFQPIFSGAEI